MDLQNPHNVRSTVNTIFELIFHANGTNHIPDKDKDRQDLILFCEEMTHLLYQKNKSVELHHKIRELKLQILHILVYLCGVLVHLHVDKVLQMNKLAVI